MKPDYGTEEISETYNKELERGNAKLKYNSVKEIKRKKLIYYPKSLEINLKIKDEKGNEKPFDFGFRLENETEIKQTKGNNVNELENAVWDELFRKQYSRETRDVITEVKKLLN
ncbi:hypothetical protein JW949_00665 [Candidatus Woesearchaeota archaeon]|nr:hypothetical protein [Candidatus Woesearchaeota archaeon]